MKDKWYNKNYIKILVLIFLVFFYILLILTHIRFLTEDLGRHITNGRLLLEDFSKNKAVLTTNFYTYNFSEFSFINHHWLSGVIFYLFYSIGGFFALDILKILILISMFLILFYISYKNSNFYITVLFSFLLIPILSERSSLRPEMFSYLLISIYWIILSRFNNKDSKLNDFMFYLIPLLNLIWVNLHIYYFIGLFLFFIFFIYHLFFTIKSKKLKDKLKDPATKKYLLVGILLILTSLLNPNFIKGAVYPLFIFNNYGYDIVENKSPFFINNLIISPIIHLYFFALFLFFLLMLLNIKKQDFKSISLSLFAICSSFFALRNLILFAMFSLPLLSSNFDDLIKKIKKKYAFVIIILILIISSFILLQNFSFFEKRIGFGIEKDSLSSIEFFKNLGLKENPKTRIFNNYDIGSYLNFFIFPNSKVYVDNRPEAFPKGFFKNTYIPMQELEEIWDVQNKLQNFTIIYFTHTESTPWSQNFLQNRILDNNWQVIYIDKHTIILSRKDIFPELNNFEINNSNIYEKLSYLFDSENVEDKLSALDILLLFNEFSSSFEICNQIIKQEPNNLQANLKLATFYSSLSLDNSGYINNAIYYYQKTLSLGYKKPSIYNALGYLYFNKGEYKKAKNYWYKALFRDPFNKTAKNYLEQYNQLKSQKKFIEK